MNLKIPGFELLRKLGSGGMGTVYLARQESLNRHVAVKVLDRVDDPSALRRFERESLLAAAVSHPNIVFIVDSGTVDGVPYLVQEFVDGSSLADLLAQRRLTVSEVCELLEPVVDTLAQLHQAGILHRDFKPRNILIDAQGRPMLSDFGLAVCVDSGSTLTQTEMVIGTLDYMAPEQRHRLEVDERADQYSLAAVVYEMLTGEKPLGAFKRPSLLNPQLPPAIDAILLRALSRDPDERFSDVRSLYSVLRATLQPGRRKSARNLLAPIALTAAVTSLLTWSIVTYEPSSNSAVAHSGSLPTTSQAETEPIVGSSSDPDEGLDPGAMTVAELRDLARSRGLTGYSGLARSELEKLIESDGRLVRLPPGWTSEIRIDAVGRRYRWYVSPDGKSYRSPPDTAESEASTRAAAVSGSTKGLSPSNSN